jgi:phage tail sheath protein FI
MPVQPTYPGVYIEEIPSGVRTITGVATSITAFLGRAPRGPSSEPTVINSFGDFERRFGGLQAAYPMSYAVRDFFLNGGSQGIIVRLINVPPPAPPVAPPVPPAPPAVPPAVPPVAPPVVPAPPAVPPAVPPVAPPVVPAPPAAPAAAAPAALDLPTGAPAPNDSLHLVAASEGAWGSNLLASVDYNTKDSTNTNLFNLNISEVDPNTKQTLNSESFLNVSLVASDALYLPRVLKDDSELVAVKKDATEHWIVPNVRPSVTANPVPATAGSGADGAGLIAGDYLGSQANKTGIFALDKADLFNLLCIPPDTRSGDTSASVYQAAMSYCQTRRAMLLVDPPAAWGAVKETAAAKAVAGLAALGLTGLPSRNAAIYFPRVLESDPNHNGQTDTFVPCGIIAGLCAATDSSRGVWKAPAGLDAALLGIQGLQVNLTDAENGQLNPLGINCLRDFKINGRVVWGARTLRGADIFADDYKYVPVRRTALYIEESLYRGTQWVVFEPNDEPLWAEIRLNVGAFMHNLFRLGAFQGKTPQEAYFVKCDKESTTQNDINLGIVNIVVGFAPLKPAEFVVIQIQQIAGAIQT